MVSCWSCCGLRDGPIGSSGTFASYPTGTSARLLSAGRWTTASWTRGGLGRAARSPPCSSLLRPISSSS
eukprot:312521-Pyramimonas_sp.AAC.1